MPQSILEKFATEGLKAKSPTTVKTYIHAISQFDKWLDGSGADLSTFARSDVQQYINYLAAKKKSASTINKLFNAIKTFCKWSGKSDTVEEINVVKQPDYKQQAPKSLDRNQYNRLIREIERTGNKRDFSIVMTLLHTGLRVSELVALDKTDVEISERKGIILVRSGKGNKERTVPLHSEARRAIQKYLEDRTDDNSALFLSNRQKRISVRSVQHIIEQNGFHVHQLRHTFITDLVRAGIDHVTIMSMTGHSSLDMIARYGKPTEEDKQKAVDNLYV